MIEVTGYCDCVEEGDKVRTPENGKHGYEKAKSLLEGLVLHQKITYKKVGVGDERITAEVWCSGKNVNDAMISHGCGSSVY